MNSFSFGLLPLLCSKTCHIALRITNNAPTPQQKAREKSVKKKQDTHPSHDSVAAAQMLQQLRCAVKHKLVGEDALG
jgi:hypothetical protein